VSFDNLEPRLGTIFSLGLALNSLFTPALRFAYAINHDNFYEVASKSLSPYCMVSLLILNVSRVDQKTEKASRYFITFWILLNYGSALIGTLFDPQNGSILTAIFHTLNIPATLFGRNVMISCRRRINEFDHEQKYSYIFRGVFFSMSTMPTILYFTIETLRCLHKESNQVSEVGDVPDISCTSTTKTNHINSLGASIGAAQHQLQRGLWSMFRPPVHDLLPFSSPPNLPVILRALLAGCQRND